MSIRSKKMVGSLVAAFTVGSLITIVGSRFIPRDFPLVNSFPSCYIDKIDGAQTSGDRSWVADSKTRLSIIGWSGDSDRVTGPQATLVMLVASNHRIISSWRGVPNLSRPDVAKTYGKQFMENTGFNIPIGPVKLPGSYTLQLGSTAEGQPGICSLEFHLRIQG